MDSSRWLHHPYSSMKKADFRFDKVFEQLEIVNPLFCHLKTHSCANQDLVALVCCRKKTFELLLVPAAQQVEEDQRVHQ